MDPDELLASWESFVALLRSQPSFCSFIHTGWDRDRGRSLGPRSGLLCIAHTCYLTCCLFLFVCQILSCYGADWGCCHHTSSSKKCHHVQKLPRKCNNSKIHSRSKFSLQIKVACIVFWGGFYAVIIMMQVCFIMQGKAYFNMALFSNFIV